VAVEIAPSAKKIFRVAREQKKDFQTETPFFLDFLKKNYKANV
jgi:hypothetical protein